MLSKLLGMMEIFLSVDNNKEILKLPYIPHDINFDSPLNVESFETVSGKTLTLVGETGLRTFTIDSFFPARKYSWIPNIISLAPTYINFLEKNRNKIMRVVVISNAININMLCTITKFNYRKQQNGNIKYSLEVKEYINPLGG